MAKLLPILGIVAAILAALCASILTGDFVPILVLVVLMAIAVGLFLERSNSIGLVLAIVVALLGLAALLSYPISGKDKTIIPSLPFYFTGPWQPTLLLLGIVAIIFAGRERFNPMWVGWVGLGAAILAAALVAPIAAADFGNGASLMGNIAAALALVTIWPMVVLLRSPATTVASPAKPAKSSKR